MYEASDIEYVGPCAGGIEIILVGDYPDLGSTRRTRTVIEFDRAAVELLVVKLENWLAETR